MDTYWFGKAVGRGPIPGEERVWSLELVTVDNKDQRGRLYIKKVGKYEDVLAAVKYDWEEKLLPMKNEVRPRSIMVMDS